MTTQSALPESTGLAGCVAAIAAVCALAWASLATTALPPPAVAGAPADAFSAGRAAHHLRALARTPRPVASAMNEDARRYIVETLRDLGLQPEVQEATVVRQSMDNQHNVHVTMAVVHNVVVRKPGVASDHARRPALLMAAHYDSDGDTLGASDAASSAALLETARALQANPPLPDDVVLLFADADRIGAMGEQAFAEQHPLARHIGLTLRFHHLGNEGPVIVQDAHGDVGAAIAAWAHANPRGSSLMREVARLMPDATGTGQLATLKAPLLQFASVEGRLGRWDTPERFSHETLQHEGDTMLSLARELGAARLDADAAVPDQIVFTLPLVGMVHYPASAIWNITGVTCLLLACVCAAAVQCGRAEAVDIVKGAFGFALAAGAPLAVLYLDGLHGAFSHLAARGGSGQPDLRYVEGVALVIAALFVLGQRRLRKHIGSMNAALGALAWLAAMLIFLSWTAPGTTYLLAIPIVCAAIVLATLQVPRIQHMPAWLRTAMLTAGMLPTVALAVPAARDAFAMTTPFRLHIPLWLLALVLAVSLPLLVVTARRFAVRGALLAGAALLALPVTASAPQHEPPAPNPLVYYKDMPTWSEWWLAGARPPDAWTHAQFPGQPKARRLVELFGWDSDNLWYTRAPRTALQFPYAILLVNDDEPTRHVAFDLTSKNAAPRIELRLDGGKPWHAVLNGRVLSHDDQIRNWSMSLYGMRDQMLHFEFDLFAGILQVGVDEHIPGLPAQALPSHPPPGPLIPLTGETISHDVLWFH
ncbi:MAG: M28 family peptidase [Telluria sp.]